MGKALDALLMAAADLDMKEMRELSKGCVNRIPATTHLSIMDVLLALNVWGEDRQKQASLDIPPKPAANQARASYEGGRDPLYPAADDLGRRQRVPLSAAPTLDDVRYLVRAPLPSLVRIMQLRKLLGMEAEPSLDGDLAEDLAALEKVREIMRAEWAVDRVVRDATCRAICVRIARIINVERA